MASSAPGEGQQTMDKFVVQDVTKDAAIKKSAVDQDQDQQDQETDKAVKADKKPEAKADEPKDVSSEDHKRKSDKLRSDKGDEAKEAGSAAEQKHTDKKPKVEPKEEAADRQQDNLPENTLEQGRVFFMYKPKVVSAGAEPHPSGLNDIQRTYLLLQPQQPSGHKSRLLVLPKKKLPDPGRHDRFFAFVEAVADSPSDLTSGLTEVHYTTKTRGERVQPAARAVAEGPYVIARGGSRNGVHLGYKLEVPQEPGEAQKVLGIGVEGSYVISAKNPDKQGQPGAPTAGPPPQYTDEQLKEFQGRSWIGIDDTSLLDVAGTELLLVGTQAEPIETGELGDAGELLQQLADDDKLQQPEQQEEVLRETLEPSEAADKQAEAIPVEPAVTGELV